MKQHNPFKDSFVTTAEDILLLYSHINNISYEFLDSYSTTTGLQIPTSIIVKGELPRKYTYMLGKTQIRNPIMKRIAIPANTKLTIGVNKYIDEIKKELIADMVYFYFNSEKILK